MDLASWGAWGPLIPHAFSRRGRSRTQAPTREAPVRRLSPRTALGRCGALLPTPRPPASLQPRPSSTSGGAAALPVSLLEPLTSASWLPTQPSFTPLGPSINMVELPNVTVRVRAGVALSRCCCEGRSSVE
jgi:hypothetical protein